MTDSTSPTKIRVLIVGAGAAGLSAAYALSQHPDQYDVRVYERSSYAGGMATSAPIDKTKYRADYINDGVQGASPVFYNTYAIFEKLGFSAADVDMQVSFGRDEETEFWTNVFPSKVIDKFGEDIKKFGTVLKIIKALEPIFAMVSVSAMLKLFRFSKEFGDTIVFPLVALFFGTGNQTPFISSAILERVFMDPNMRLFEYSPNTFLASVPKMKAFPRLSLLYDAWKSFVEEQGSGSVRVNLNREVTRIKRFSRKKGAVEVWSRPTNGTDNSQEVVDPGEEETENFDEIIICTDADAALTMLGNDARWLERRVLGNVKYLWDVTVTHNDLNYMEKYYRVRYDPMLCSEKDREDPERQKQFEFAKKNFAPLYFIRSHPKDKSKLEMSFDLTCYQPQFDGISAFGPNAQSVQDDDKSQENHDDDGKIPLEQHVFQTIFLNKDPESSQYWSKQDIDGKKVIMEKWWKQQSHRWQHYAGTVPWMGLINGKHHTYFAGAWTVLNMHEIAVVSGFAAAYRLGAEYPFSNNAEGKRLFALCLAANHMARLRKEDRMGIFT
ncbi:hypothetical protein AMATHDRAFT_75855 [Amanita thiersii Skay4041]|uniref:Amine oxidase domain-containing protein n=1 Tax=Amanita thiersii Skay4041 TaxID=703135 RepID=A0A2A9NIY1_9AGAR|nr:hypothetical protein AMATHDRAFT_75855 [Amanita thiersii Skay4041]